MVVENALTDERFRRNPLVTGSPHIQFYAGHPLTGPGGTHVGTFCIVDQAPRQFSAAQQKILEDLTAIIQREMNLSWDIDTGARVQRALQATVPRPPAGYSLGTCYYPASGVSGDFYEFGTTADGQFRLTVGDAMGKGVGPGLVAGTVRSAFGHAAGEAEPERIFTTVAEKLEETLARIESFATVFHAVVDPETGVGRYADAGQGLSSILRADGTLEQLPPTGPPLGLVPGQRWASGTFRLGPGDAILIPTDGLLDLHGGSTDLLASAVSQVQTDDNVDAAVKKLCDRRGKGIVLDDITAVLFRRDAPPA